MNTEITMTRQERRALERELAKPPLKKAGPGRRNKWLMRHPKIAGYYSMATLLLQNSDRAQRPSWKAVRKMMVVLATAPRVAMPGVGKSIPYPLAQARHERPSWRTFPHQTIDANLKVQS